MSTTDITAESKSQVKEAKKQAGTEYVVLIEVTPNDSDTRTWKEGPITGTAKRPISAGNTTDAVRKAAAGKEGVYVAVPARSFQPQRVKVETTTHLRLEDA